MVKSINSSIKPKKSLENRSVKKEPKRDPQSKVSPWLDDYLEFQTMQLKPVTIGFIHRLCSEVIEWAGKKDSIVFRDFVDGKRIPEEAYYRWVRTYPELKAAHTMAKGMIGSRREKAGLSRKMDPGLVMSSMPNYDQEWKDMLSWKASLKEQAHSAPITINLPDITSKQSE